MALNLYGYNIEDEPRGIWSPEKLAVFLVRRLNFDPLSSLHRRINIGAEGAPPSGTLPGAARVLSLAAVVDGVLRQFSRNPKRDRDLLRSERFWSRKKRVSLDDDGTPLRHWYRDSRDSRIYGLIRDFVVVVDDLFWSTGVERSMLTRAVGVRALFDFLVESLTRHPEIISSWEEQDSSSLRVIRESLQRCTKVDFTDPYFEATGRGRKRILNVLLVGAELSSLSSFAGSDHDEMQRIIRRAEVGTDVI